MTTPPEPVSDPIQEVARKVSERERAHEALCSRSEWVVDFVKGQAGLLLFVAITTLSALDSARICWLLPVVLSGIVINNFVRGILDRKSSEQRVREAERTKREHEAWLRTTQGIAWQAEQREKERRQKEEEERRLKQAEELVAREKWRQYHESKTMDEVSRMSGLEFEEFLARLFSRMGYRDITLTATNDQGGDILGQSPNGARAVVQAKRWNGTVGNAAVQELLAAILYYDRAVGIVVTNSTFSRPARELARKDSRVTLCDGRWLAEQIKKFLPPEIPEFNWEEFNRVVKNYKPPRACGNRKAKFRRYR